MIAGTVLTGVILGGESDNDNEKKISSGLSLSWHGIGK
jgi:hypothetical protein